MSTLSVDLIEPVGSTLTLGQSGDTITIPAGGTFTNSGTATGFASGSTHASQWRLTTDFTGSADPITTNLEEVDAPVGFGVLGGSMVLGAGTGVFTFPVTGYWEITAFGGFGGFTLAGAAAEIYIYTTANNSVYVTAAKGFGGVYYGDNTAICSYIMDVTDVTQCKVRFRVYQASASVTTRGDTGFNETFFTFNRLADT
jgi:hypothetical protein